MHILVTGGAGYIGSVLVPLLLENGYSVRVLDNLMYGNGTGLLPHFRNQHFEFIRGDIRDRSEVQDAIKGCDAVIHLAAIVGFPACRKYPDLAQSVNVEGTGIIGNALDRRPIIFSSTGSNYGALEQDVCTEETLLNPLSLYGKTKTAAEEFLRQNCNTIAYRFATGFGISPRMRLDLLVNDFVYQALKVRHLVVYESRFMRTFIHVYDIARAFLFALDNVDVMVDQVYNVGSESMNYSKAQVCEAIHQKVNFYLHYADVGKDADGRNYVVSYKKINALGYYTTITLNEGIDELIHGMQAIDVRNQYSNV